jgi:hypothetical protein
MCNCEEDFSGVAKYKSKKCLTEKIIEYSLAVILILAILTISIALINPHYFG